MMNKMTRENNFVYLFFSLIIFLLAASLTSELKSEMSEMIFSSMTMLMLLVSIKSLNSEKTWKWAFIFLAVIFILFILIGLFFNHQVPVYIVLVLLFVFFTSALYVAGKQVLFLGDIDWNKIIGSISLYLLLGLMWTVVYLFILVFDPTAFSGVEVSTWQQGFSRMAYYSFVTLTTLGYGDILPTNHIAEFFVYMEAIVGVFYMAIIVSSLISLRLAAIQKKGK